MDNSVVDILSAVHTLKGCDTTSKIGTEFAAFQILMKYSAELLHSFGKAEISDQMIFLAERFLVECISKSSERNNFDDTCYETYHQKSLQLDLKITTEIIIHHIHIKGEFLLYYLWLHAPFLESHEINSKD